MGAAAASSKQNAAPYRPSGSLLADLFNVSTGRTGGGGQKTEYKHIPGKGLYALTPGQPPQLLVPEDPKTQFAGANQSAWDPKTGTFGPQAPGVQQQAPLSAAPGHMIRDSDEHALD